MNTYQHIMQALTDSEETQTALIAYEWLERHASARLEGDTVIYTDDATCAEWRGPIDDLVRLGELLSDDYHDVRRDAYSLWCSETSHAEIEQETTMNDVRRCYKCNSPIPRNLSGNYCNTHRQYVCREYDDQVLVYDGDPATLIQARDQAESRASEWGLLSLCGWVWRRRGSLMRVTVEPIE